jgi:Protein of unknown function (DUF3775)
MILQPKTVSTIIKQLGVLAKQHESELPQTNSPLMRGEDRLPALLERLANPGGSPEKQQLRAFIDNLSWQERAELTAIFWVGRDCPETDAETFNFLVEQAKRKGLDDTADYLLSIVPSQVGDWLSKGLTIVRSF